MRIGLDFDNTIICYDAVFLDVARKRGLLPAGFAGDKQQVRDAIRLLPDGEINWQRLQGHVYGRGIGGATPFPGLHAFLASARRRGDELFIVSHKTEYGHFDPERVNLRDAARDWMRREGFFAESGAAMKPENVFFAHTRAEKLARISALGCDAFVDDLEEVLDDPDFPPATRRILFSKHSGEHRAYLTCADWPAVEEALFRDR